ncbi:MAG TPA: hypothetical protein DCS93_18490 [Microscillaceae bacterium]|nr:hypothetical protein [Microscillaceae bacterium]
MKKISTILTVFILWGQSSLFLKAQNIHPKLLPYYQVLKTQGKSPIDFMREKISRYDLLIFDDALHPAQEPFDFYQQLIRDAVFGQKLHYVFLEILPVTAQRHLDAFLNAPTKNHQLLYPAFQQTFDGYASNYKTYFDLLEAVWEVNQQLPDSDKIRVMGTDIPLLWAGIEYKTDWQNFRKTLKGRDYNLYRVILDAMKGFKQGKKGIFLTNTRHAYKGVRNKQGDFHWNCGTFFAQNHPGKTYAIRIHNISLDIYKQVKKEAQTAQGLDRVKYRWIRMEQGIWDAAFEALGEKPVTISLKGNVFGKAAYLGNHSLTAREGQTMFDAYDALVMLKPLEQLHFSGRVGAVYTLDFQQEMIRRLKVLNNPTEIKALLKQHNMASLKAYVKSLAKDAPAKPNPLIKLLGSKEAWKK